MIKLKLPSDLCEYVAWPVALGGYVSAGEYMCQLIRSNALVQRDRRLRDGLVAHEYGHGDVSDDDSL